MSCRAGIEQNARVSSMNPDVREKPAVSVTADRKRRTAKLCVDDLAHGHGFVGTGRATRHFTKHHSGDIVEGTGLPQVGQHAIDSINCFANVLQNQNRSLEVRRERRSEESCNEREIAADLRSRATAERERRRADGPSAPQPEIEQYTKRGFASRSCAQPSPSSSALPGRKFSMSTSAPAASRWTNRAPSGFRSRWRCVS